MKLSKPQKLVYDMQKIAEGSIGNICGSILFDKEYSVDELQNALCEIVRLNDALRIRIKEMDGEIHQCVDDYVPLIFDILSFSDRKELEAYCKRFARKPIDMSGVLYRFFIVKIGERVGVICKIHHLIGDAWTLSLIGTQINMLLNGETPGAYSYLDYITGEDDYRQSKRFEKDRIFFEEQFKKCDEATYLNEKHSESYTAERLTYTVNAADTAKMTEYANKKGVSVFSLLLAAFSVYVSRVKMNAEKFYIGTAVLNRGSAKEKNTMGMFINTVPVLIEFDNSLSFVENLSRVSDNTFAVLRHQKYNYGDFLEYLREKYHFSEKLYDVIISYQNAKVLGGGVETTWYSNGMQTESLQMHIDDRDGEGILKINYDYLTEKFTSHEIEMLHAHLFHLLFDAMENEKSNAGYKVFCSETYRCRAYASQGYV